MRSGKVRRAFRSCLCAVYHEAREFFNLNDPNTNPRKLVCFKRGPGVPNGSLSQSKLSENSQFYSSIAPS